MLSSSPLCLPTYLAAEISDLQDSLKFNSAAARKSKSSTRSPRRDVKERKLGWSQFAHNAIFNDEGITASCGMSVLSISWYRSNAF